MTKRLLIAIDGPASSGKGTLARRLAEHYLLPHLDTGMLYRAVAFSLLERGDSLDDVAAATKAAHLLGLENLPADELRKAPLGEAASVVAVYPEVREALLDVQRKFARHPHGAVIDGRDIGTVICPDADVKLFVTASAEVRARRRFEQRRANGLDDSYEKVLADIRKRDERDSSRSDAPLKQAEDALLLDTSNLGIDDAFRAALDMVEAARGSVKSHPSLKA
ncbi:MAG: (d)CMP kinase [Pseudomonadota bacterium]